MNKTLKVKHPVTGEAVTQEVVIPDNIIQAIALHTEQYVFNTFQEGHVRKLTRAFKETLNPNHTIKLTLGELTAAQREGLAKLGLLPSVISNKRSIDESFMEFPST